MEKSRDVDDSKIFLYAQTILEVCVIAVIIMAPLGMPIINCFLFFLILFFVLKLSQKKKLFLL